DGRRRGRRGRRGAGQRDDADEDDGRQGADDVPTAPQDRLGGERGHGCSDGAVRGRAPAALGTGVEIPRAPTDLLSGGPPDPERTEGGGSAGRRRPSARPSLSVAQLPWLRVWAEPPPLPGVAENPPPE